MIIKTPLAFIENLRKGYGVTRFMNGDCFKLYLMMKRIWPESEAWYDGIEGHVYISLFGKFYDINGQHDKLPRGSYLMKTEPRIYQDAHNWSYE